MAKPKLWLSRPSATMSRRILLTGAAATTSTLVLAACTSGSRVEGVVPTVTRVPAEGAPPTQPPAGATPAGATPEGGATPATGEATPAVDGTPAAGATPEAGGAGVGPLIAVDIGWELGNLATLNSDAITLTVTPGTTFEMISEGVADHNFTVDDLEVAVPVPPGETVEVTIPDDTALGEYEFYCSIPGHRQVGMVGTLVVQEGAPGVPAAAGEAASPAAEEAVATPAGDEEAAAGDAAVGPLVAVDIAWELGDLNTMNGDAITLTVSPGTTFEMISEGAAEHDFTVDELAVQVAVAPGETVEVTIPDDAAAGEYEFYCSIPGHREVGMVGTLVVE